MRFDTMRPLTVVLLAAASWALLGWLLALAGMGGRLGDYEEAISAPALPPSSQYSASTVQGVQAYPQSIQRPVFFPQRRPLPFALRNDEDNQAQPDAFDFILTGVLISPTARMASLQYADGRTGPRVREGDGVEGFAGWRLQQLQPRAAVFVGPEGERRLLLRQYLGQQDAARSPSSAPASPAVVPAPANRAGAAIDAAAAAGNAAQDAAIGAEQAAVASAGSKRPAVDLALPSQEQLEIVRQRIQARRAQLQQERAGSGSQ